MKKQEQGRKNRRAGLRFEKKVRADLESKGWIVSKWQNNIEFPKDKKGRIYFKKDKHPKIFVKKNKLYLVCECGKEIPNELNGYRHQVFPECCPKCGKGVLVPSIISEEDFEYMRKKQGFKGKCVPAKMGKFRSNQGGYPDFICYRIANFYSALGDTKLPVIVFVEAKSNGYLSKEEKEKAKWYLENNYCSEFLVAFKKGRGKIEYKEVEE